MKASHSKDEPPGTPSPFLVKHLDALAVAARQGPVLDLACGAGRHALAVARLGVPVLALDRDTRALAGLAERSRSESLRVQPVRCDLEAGLDPPVADESCGAILVFRYLYRPLAPALVRLLKPGGLLLYETFTLDQRDLPHGPGNPHFLLSPGELPGLFPELRVEQSWEGREPRPFEQALARLAARKPA